MPDVFISYAREDRDTAHALAEALQRHAIDAWWDRELTGGGDFAQEIEQNLRAAPVAVVLWSAASVRSDFVRDESSRVRDQHKLLPVRIGEVELPLGFGTLHTLDLLDWDGGPLDPACLAVVEQVRQRVAQARQQPATPAPPIQPLALAESTLGLRRRRRRLLLGAGLAGGAVALGLGAFSWRQFTRREAIGHLAAALEDHFAQPPRLERAQSEYRSALDLDDALAPAHYFLAHLYAQIMLRGSPPPRGELLDALRADARTHFTRALDHADRLDGAQRVIARGQLALLSQEDAAPALDRPLAAAGEAPEPSPAPSPAPSAAPSPPAASPPAAAVAARPGDTAGRAAELARNVEELKRLQAAAGATPGVALAPPASLAASAPPRVAATPAQAQAARARAEALFGTDRDARLAAATSLTLDPAAAAEALPAAIALARRGLASAPAAGPAAEALQQGLAATLALATRASPSSLRDQAGALRALLATLAEAPAGRAHAAAAQALGEALDQRAGLAPLAYLQIAHAAQRPIADALARRLVAAGYRAPGIELTGPTRAPARPAVRAQGGSDPELGRWCQRALAEAAGAPAELVVLRRAQPRTDTFELWFDAGLCAPGGRQPATCA